MGYRSEVALALKNETFKQMIHTMSDEIAPEILIGTKRFFAEGWILIKWDSVKWYDQFPEVAAVEAFMNNLDSSDRVEEYAFARVGEEWDDIEERGSCCRPPFHLSVQRSVSLDWFSPVSGSSEPPEGF